MYVKIAEKAGFCFGVERAIALAEQAAERYGEIGRASCRERVYVLV